MLTFNEYLVELYFGPRIASTGTDAERHHKKYVAPFLPGGASHAENTHTVISKTDTGLTSGTRVTLHGHKIINGEHHVIVTPEGSNKKQTISVSKLAKPKVKKMREAEDTAIADLHNKIVEHNKTKPLKMKDRFGNVHNIVGAVQVRGNPKADIALVNDKGEHVIHISHKKSPTSHQGYGALNSAKNINHPTVKEFGDKLKKSVGNEEGALKGKSRTMQLSHNNPTHSGLIKSALFGTHNDDKKSGVENVDEIHHGTMNLVKNKDGTHSLGSELKVDRNNYKEHDYDVVAKGATDRFVPGTKVKGIIGINTRGARTGKDVKGVE